MQHQQIAVIMIMKISIDIQVLTLSTVLYVSENENICYNAVKSESLVYYRHLRRIVVLHLQRFHMSLFVLQLTV